MNNPHNQQEPPQHINEDAEKYIRQDGLMVGIASLSLLCGMHFSPYFDPAFFLVRAFIAPNFGISSLALTYYFTALLVSLSALLFAGIPAAAYERKKGLDESSGTSMGIWFGMLVLFSIPVFASWF